MMGPKRRDEARSQGDNIYRPPEGLNAIEPQPLNPYLPDKILGPLLIAIVGATSLGIDLIFPEGNSGKGSIPGDIPPNPPPQLPPKDPGSGSGSSPGGSSGGSAEGGIVQITFQAYSLSGNYSSQRAFNGETWYASSSATSSSGQKIENEKKLAMRSSLSYSYFAKNHPDSSGGRSDNHISEMPKIADLKNNSRFYLGFWGGAPLYANGKTLSTYFLDGGGPLKFQPIYFLGSEKGISQWINRQLQFDNWSYNVDMIDWIPEIYSYGKISGYTSQSSTPSLIYEEPAGEYQNPNFFNGGGSPPPPSKECEECMGCDCTTTADLLAQLIFQQQKREDDLKEFIQRTALEQLEITKKMLGNIELTADYQPIIDRVAKAESTLWNGAK